MTQVKNTNISFGKGCLKIRRIKGMFGQYKLQVKGMARSLQSTRKGHDKILAIY